MVKTPAVLVITPLVGLDVGVLVVTVKLESRGVAEMISEERGLDNEVKVKGKGVSSMDVPGNVEVMAGIGGIEVRLFKQTSELPALTVTTGVTLPTSLESARTITTLVSAGIVTRSQVNEKPVMLVKAARMDPPALPS